MQKIKHPDNCPYCQSDEVYYERMTNEYVCHDCGWDQCANCGKPMLSGKAEEQCKRTACNRT